MNKELVPLKAHNLGNLSSFDINLNITQEKRITAWEVYKTLFPNQRRFKEWVEDNILSRENFENGKQYFLKEEYVLIVRSSSQSKDIVRSSSQSIDIVKSSSQCKDKKVFGKQAKQLKEEFGTENLRDIFESVCPEKLEIVGKLESKLSNLIELEVPEEQREVLLLNYAEKMKTKQLKSA